MIGVLIRRVFVTTHSHQTTHTAVRGEVSVDLHPLYPGMSALSLGAFSGASACLHPRSIIVPGIGRIPPFFKR
jgi:hypothetical protein